MSDSAAEADGSSGRSRGQGHVAAVVAWAHAGAKAYIDVGADASVRRRQGQRAVVRSTAGAADLKACGSSNGQVGLEVAADDCDALRVGSSGTRSRCEASQAGGRH